jgi:hypothetical protein
VITLGTVSYTQAQLQPILDQSAKGNGLVTLAHQLVAAKLNVAHGADPADAAQAISDADAMIGGLVIPPIGSGYLPPGQTSELVETLTQCNEGTMGPATAMIKCYWARLIALLKGRRNSVTIR